MVARDLADRAQLALESVALAQQPRDRIAAAVGEAREVYRHDLEQGQVCGDGRGVLVAVGVPALLLSTLAPQPVLVAGLVSCALVAAAVLLDLRTPPVEAETRSR